MSNLSDKIKAIRISKGMTQKQLADILDVSQNAIYNWENGKREIKIETLQKIANALNVPIIDIADDLVTPLRKENWKTTEKERLEIAQEKDLLRNYHSLNSNGRKEACKRVQELAEILRYIEPDTPELNAAHTRTDIDIPDNVDTSENDIMDDENF